MPKKLKVNTEVEPNVVPVSLPTQKIPISEFSQKFGREDMDKLVDKLNEVIRHINE